ncbi:MAG: hypothetical protein ACE5D0_10535 [Fidelibacterota bacterium]
MIVLMGKYLFVIMMGIFFALIQTCYFFQLEIWLTAAYPAYLTIMLGWLIGNVAGLRMFQSGENPNKSSLSLWLILSVAAYYFTICFLQVFPYRMELLPIYGVMIGVSGALAGRFFVSARFIFKTSAKLFFMENNGFVLGWILGFMGFVWRGHTFNLVAPLVMGIICFALCQFVSRNQLNSVYQSE